MGLGFFSPAKNREQQYSVRTPYSLLINISQTSPHHTTHPNPEWWGGERFLCHDVSVYAWPPGQPLVLLQALSPFFLDVGLALPARLDTLLGVVAGAKMLVAVLLCLLSFTESGVGD